MFRSDWIFVAKAVAGALVVMLALVTVWSLLKRTTRSILRGCWAVRFRRIFGLWPSKDPLERKILQLAVDKKIAWLEAPFRELCQEEDKLDTEYRRCNVAGRDPWEDAPLACKTKRALARAKKRFYGACDAAKKFGFVVQKEVWR